MKWIVFAFGLAGVVPLAGWLRGNRLYDSRVWMFVAFCPFVLTAIPNLNISLIGWPAWPGIVKGLQVTAFDLLMLAVYAALPRTPREPLPFRIPMALYFGAVLLSLSSAQVPFATIFYAWQLLRVFFVYAVVTRACADERVVVWLLQGMAIGLCFEAAITLWERVGLNVVQTSGTFGHQNILGVVSHFVAFPVFALLLAGTGGWLFACAPLAGMIIAALTASRATLGFGAAGYILVLVISMARRVTARKTRLAVALVIAAAVIAPVAAISLQRRWTETGNIEEYDERAALILSAQMMLSDHPLGVGANNFGSAGTMLGYAIRAGVSPNWGSLSAQVHNIYWHTAAETGYLGLAALLLLLLCPLVSAFSYGWRSRHTIKGDLLLGQGVTLFVVYIHSYFEWSFLTYQIQYFYAISIGIIAGTIGQLNRTQSLAHYSARRASRSSSGTYDDNKAL